MTSSTFDPARDGFGFRNPVGMVPERAGGLLLRRLDGFMYGGGLCFGMAAAALANYVRSDSPYSLAARSLTPEVLTIVRSYHARQLAPGVVLAFVRDWVGARGGSPGGLFGRLRLPGDRDPHVLTFGPAFNKSFFRCFYYAHAVVPYRVEEERLYVYDPNHPKDRERFVAFRDGGFEYGPFASAAGWGITLVPLSAVEVRR